jgi:uncharacterized membrane protein (DUF106 family)
MDEYLDILWFKIVALTQMVVRVLDALVSPFNTLGPALIIFILVFITVCFTKLFKRLYTTKRYENLKKEFTHWSEIRKEAMQIEDREKGKMLAKNIDQAKLNKVYYDYFFEGFLNNILTTILPILLMAAYINESYNPENLLNRFDRSYIFKIPGLGGDPSPVGAMMWFVLSLILVHLLWAIVARLFRKKRKQEQSSPTNK